MSAAKKRGDSSSPYRLLVEGADDVHSVFAICQRHGFDWYSDTRPNPFIKDNEGIENLLGALPTTLKSNVTRLGIIVDADLDLAHRWTAVRGRIIDAGIVDMPEEPVRDGWIARNPIPAVERVGVWLMPDNTTPGILEDFISTLIPKDDSTWPVAKSATNEAMTRGAPIAPAMRVKGELYAWLAWREQPGRPLGQSISATVLRHDSPLAGAFMSWFRGVFED